MLYDAIKERNENVSRASHGLAMAESIFCRCPSFFVGKPVTQRILSLAIFLRWRSKGSGGRGACSIHTSLRLAPSALK